MRVAVVQVGKAKFHPFGHLLLRVVLLQVQVVNYAMVVQRLVVVLLHAVEFVLWDFFRVDFVFGDARDIFLGLGA